MNRLKGRVYLFAGIGLNFASLSLIILGTYMLGKFDMYKEFDENYYNVLKSEVENYKKQGFNFNEGEF